MGVELVRRYVSIAMRSCYRSALRHPFLVVMFFLLIWLYRSFPLFFSLLVYASPVIVSTAVLLGTLLSFGHPNIPQIREEGTPDHDQIHNLKTEIVGRDGSFACEETRGGRKKPFGKKTSVVRNIAINNDDHPCVETDKPESSVDSSVSMTNEKSKRLQSEVEHIIGEARSEVGNQKIDVNEEKAVLNSRCSQLRPSKVEYTKLESNSAAGLSWKHVEEHRDEDNKGSESGSDLVESSSPDTSMADIIPMLDELHPLLDEEPEVPQSTHMSNVDTDDASACFLESADIINDDDDDDDDDSANQEDIEVKDDEEEEEANMDKEDETVITWTEDDQKNLMNLGTSELERNQRLENLIAARKNMRMLAEKNKVNSSPDLTFNVISPGSTARNNPFDLPYDSNENIPGSAPPILVPRRNPFDLPYESSEDKPDPVGASFHSDSVAFQPNDPFFRRHENFDVGPSTFGASRQERQEFNLGPYFVPERIASQSAGDMTAHQKVVSGFSEIDNLASSKEIMSNKIRLNSSYQEKTSSGSSSSSSSDVTDRIYNDKEGEENLGSNYFSASVSDETGKNTNWGPFVGEEHLHKDKSFQNTKDQPQSSSSVANVKRDSTLAITKTTHTEDQHVPVPNYKEQSLAVDKSSTQDSQKLQITEISDN